MKASVAIKVIEKHIDKCDLDLYYDEEIILALNEAIELLQIRMEEEEGGKTA